MEKSTPRSQSTALILAVLRDASRHGYDIAREVERRSGDRIIFNDGTLYPVLRSLEAEGLVNSDWDQPEGERRRRVYRLTERGADELQRQISSWRDYSAAVDRVIDGQVGHFGAHP